MLFGRLAQVDFVDDERAHAPQRDGCELEFFALYLQECDMPTDSDELYMGIFRSAYTHFSIASPSARDVATDEPGWVM